MDVYFMTLLPVSKCQAEIWICIILRYNNVSVSFVVEFHIDLFRVGIAAQQSFGKGRAGMPVSKCRHQKNLH